MVNIPGEDAYNVRIGAGVLDALGSSMRGVPAVADARQALVITDANVGPLYLARAKASLVQAGYRVSDICVPAGEEAKSLTVLGEVLEAMAALALERDCVVVALGGGCVGDSPRQPTCAVYRWCRFPPRFCPWWIQAWVGRRA